MNSHRHRPLPPVEVFLRHLGRKAAIALGIILMSLLIGATGYHLTENLPWLDATLNASMILTGMGPVSALHTSAGKIFAIFYSLFSGVVFITLAAVLMAPALHRFLHRFHLELEPEDEQRPEQP